MSTTYTITTVKSTIIIMIVDPTITTVNNYRTQL